MPSKKKKYNARFPAGRIKKIMQSDEEIGKVAQAVPIIIWFVPVRASPPRTLELFVESLLTKTVKITNLRNAKTLSTSHMKQCIMSEQRFDFLRELVKTIPDISVAEEAAAAAAAAAGVSGINQEADEAHSSPEEATPDVDSDVPYDLSMPSTSLRASRANGRGATTAAPDEAYSPNGGMRSHLKREATRWQRPAGSYRLSADDSSSSETAVGHKFSRSDSTPASASGGHRERLKHQSLSVPGPGPGPAAAAGESLLRYPQQQHSHLAATAIPAPIVSFDFCSKPVVKIEYSHLPASASPATALPHDDQQPLIVSPVINIDLSNIVADAAGTAVGAVAAPAVATISIGAPLTAASHVPRPTASKTTTTSPARPATNTAKVVKSVGGGNAAAASYLELDEDYDDI